MEPRSLLVTRHDPSTFRKIGSKNATNFWNCSKSLKKFGGRKNFSENCTFSMDLLGSFAIFGNVDGSWPFTSKLQGSKLIQGCIFGDGGVVVGGGVLRLGG